VYIWIKNPGWSPGFFYIFTPNYRRMVFTPGFISGSEIIIIFFVILLLFGADKIPDIARTLGKGMREFRKVTNDLKREINNSTRDLKDDVEDLKKDIDRNKEEISGKFRKYVDESDISKGIDKIKDDLKG